MTTTTRNGEPVAAPRPRAATAPTPLTGVCWVLGGIALLFLISPLVLDLLVSFGSGNFVQFPPRSWTTANYANLDPTLVSSALFSVELGVLACAIALVIGVPAGTVLARKMPLGGLASAFVQAPLQVPGVVVGVALLQYYGLIARSTGIYLLGSFGGLLIAHVLIVTPYVVAAVVAGLASADGNLEEAAFGLGASRPRVFFSVLIPSIRSSIWSAGFFAFLTSFDEVPVSLFVSIPNHTSLPVQMFFDAEFSPQPSIYVASALVAVLSCAAVIIFDRAVGIRRVTSAAS